MRFSCLLCLLVILLLKFNCCQLLSNVKHQSYSISLAALSWDLNEQGAIYSEIFPRFQDPIKKGSLTGHLPYWGRLFSKSVACIIWPVMALSVAVSECLQNGVRMALKRDHPVHVCSDHTLGGVLNNWYETCHWRLRLSTACWGSVSGDTSKHINHVCVRRWKHWLPWFSIGT